MNSWPNKFLSKFDETQEKLELLVESINKDCFWDPTDLADQLLSIEDHLDEINYKIADLQYQLDIKKVNPSNKEKDRIKEYDIQQNILKSLFPVMLYLNEHYRNKSDNKSDNKSENKSEDNCVNNGLKK